MIQIENVEKYYDDFRALGGVSLTVKNGSIFGFIGSNGSGKSTLLRVMAGIFKSEKGRVLIDGEDVYENTATKKRIVYISDEQYILPSSTAADVRAFYKIMYPSFDAARFDSLLARFSLDVKRQV